MLSDLPVFGVCGWSGSGKTALLEELLPRLRAAGLAVAVVKHDAHGVVVDPPGKDSDRLFRAGADVLLQGPGEELCRTHRGQAPELESALLGLSASHDLVLVEGHKDTPLPKVWLLNAGESGPPAGVPEVLAALPPGPGRVEALGALLADWLPRQWLKTPVFGCVLIGGGSRRMGRPKHLLVKEGRTWLERTAALLRGVCCQVAIAGAGEVPETLAGCVRLTDVPDAEGPMAGILAGMRWAPRAAWLVAACDHPELSVEALEWLLAQRAPGTWAVLPRLPGREAAEPLLAYYDFRARARLEALAARGDFRPRTIAGSPEVLSQSPPEGLLRAWRSANTPDQAAAAE